METSESVKTALRQQAEAGVCKLQESLQTLFLCLQGLVCFMAFPVLP